MVPGALPRCIRLLVHAYTQRTRDEIRHLYLRGATVLRPDRAGA
jgi:chorismate mutase